MNKTQRGEKSAQLSQEVPSSKRINIEQSIRSGRKFYRLMSALPTIHKFLPLLNDTVDQKIKFHNATLTPIRKEPTARSLNVRHTYSNVKKIQPMKTPFGFLKTQNKNKGQLEHGS